MKLLLMGFFALMLCCMTFTGLAAENGKKKEKGADKSSDNSPKLRHTVFLKFKDTATKEQIKQVEDAFRALKSKIPEVDKLEWGTNISPEKHDKGFTHAFILSFKSEKDRDTYLAHPAHKEFGKVLGPVMGDVFVIDFWQKH